MYMYRYKQPTSNIIKPFFSANTFTAKDETPHEDLRVLVAEFGFKVDGGCLRPNDPELRGWIM